MLLRDYHTLINLFVTMQVTIPGLFFFWELDIYCPQLVRLQDIVQRSDYTR